MTDTAACSHGTTGTDDQDGLAYIYCYECGRLLDEIGPAGTVEPIYVKPATGYMRGVKL